MGIFNMYKYKIIVKGATKEYYIKTIDKNYKYTLTSNIQEAKSYLRIKKAISVLNKLREIEGNKGTKGTTKFLLG